MKAEPKRIRGKRMAKKVINDMAFPMLQALDGLNVPQLKSVLAVAKQLSTTNCGWQEYWLKDAIVRFTEDRLAELKKEKLRLKGKAK